MFIEETRQMTEQPVICQNCHTEMTPGTKTRSKVMEWTEYTCPDCGSIWSDGKPLPGHEPKYAEPKVLAVEPEEMDAEIEARADYIKDVVLAEAIPGVIPEVTLDEPVVGEAKAEPEPKPRSKRKRRAKVADEGVVGDEVAVKVEVED